MKKRIRITKKMNIVFLATIWSLIFSVWRPLPVFGQHAYALKDLARMANKHSEDIKIAEDDLYISRMQKKKATSVLFPSITAYTEATEQKNDDQTNPDSTAYGVRLNYSFTLNGMEWIACDMAEQTVQSRKLSLESIRSQFLLKVAQTYYNILKAGDALDIAVSDVDRLAGHRNAVRENLGVGKMTQTDLYRAQAELAKSMTEQVRAENTLLKSRSVLRNLLDISEDFELVRSAHGRFENFSVTLPEITTVALKNRTEIKAARKEFEIAGRMIYYEKSRNWPSVSVETGYRETDIRYGDAPLDGKVDDEAYYITGQLSFQLFDAGHRRAAVRQAQANWRKAKNSLSLIEKQVVLDSQSAFWDYQSAKSAMENLVAEVRSAKENFHAVQMQLKYGIADSIDMIDANTLMVASQRRISDARYSYILSVLKILHARGDLIAFLLNES